ncbi:LAME_0B00452g1_1 [Lachancea meyersii CBS 8951]|uniref:LAME_0B00452g1_1 n=1 Tax=Lachancea meyersii CBS 8951 TaxID=1266667 RepID=A0A1G4IT06_9SACH|nr:LAME_0B00452g1_1 [Lachancea meyersii CBS 8951]
MGKKVSKNSRASRRFEALDTEAQTLAQLPRAQDLDVTNKLIRTASKNEQLLEAKMRKKDKTSNKVGKKTIKKSALENLDSERVARALNISSRLDGKVEKAKTRAKYVQSARKAGWESTNESIRRDLAKLTEREGSVPEAATQSGSSGDQEVDSMVEDDPAEEIEQNPQEAPSAAENMFGLLADDVEA